MTQTATKVCKTEGRLSHWLAAFLFGALVSIGGSSSASAQNQGLADGLQLLSVYKNVSPKAAETFEDMMKTAPADVRQKVQASNWADSHTIKTPAQLEDAALDPNLHLVQTPNGLITLPRDKTPGAVEGLVNHSLAHGDMAKFQSLLRSVQDKIPPEYRDQAQKIDGYLGALTERDSLAANAARIAIRAAVSTLVIPALNNHLAKTTDAMRDEINKDGAAAVFAKVQQQSDELRRRAEKEAARLAAIAADQARAKAEAEKREKARQDADKAKAAASKAKAEKRAKLKERIGQSLDELERAIPQIAKVSNECMRAVSSTDPRRPADDVDAALKKTTDDIAKLRDALPLADRVAANAQALTRLIAPAQKTADSACVAAASSTPAKDKAQLEATRDLARQSFDDLKTQAAAALSRLSPVDRSGLIAIRAAATATRDSCAKPRQDPYIRIGAGLTGKAAAWLSSVSGRRKQVFDDFKAAEDNSGMPDLELVALRVAFEKLLAKLGRSFAPSQQCVTEAMEINKYCRAVAGNQDLNRIGLKMAEVLLLEPGRRTAHQKLEDTLARINSELATLNQIVDRGQACIDRTAAAGTAADPQKVEDLADPSKALCKVADLRSRIAQLRNPRLSSVPGIKDKVAELLRLANIVGAAEADYERARDAYYKGDTKTAIADLAKAKSRLEALGSPLNCGKVIEKIAESSTRSERLTEALQRGEETLRQCDRATMSSHMQAIEDRANHPALTALKQRMAAQLRAKSLYQRAVAALAKNNKELARDLLARIQSPSYDDHPGDCAGDRTNVSALENDVAQACGKSYVKNYSLNANSKTRRYDILAALETCRRDDSGATGPDVATAPPPPRVIVPPPVVWQPPFVGPPPVITPPVVRGPAPTTTGPSPTRTPGPSKTPVATAPPAGSGPAPSPSPFAGSGSSNIGGKTTTSAGCDPTKVAKPKPPAPNKDGLVFVPVTQGPNEGYNPDCPPIGPAAKDVADGAPTTDSTDDKTAKACGDAEAVIKRGREQFLAGNYSDYRAALSGASRSLDQLHDSKACAEQRDAIAKGNDQADLLEKVVKVTDQALEKCEGPTLQRLSAQLSKTSHPHVTKLRAQIDRMAAVTVKISAADAALAKGQKGTASSLYREAAAALNLDPNVCQDLAEHVRDAQEKISTAKVAPVSDVLIKTYDACQAKLGVHGRAVKDLDFLTGYRCVCAKPYTLEGNTCVKVKSLAELLAAAQSGCRSAYGNRSYAKETKAGSRKFTCGCKSGSQWNSAQTQCIRLTRAQVIADANRRCQKANRNRRARAGKHLGNGRWTCYLPGQRLTRSQIIADANRRCRKANRNRRARALKHLGNGQWSCYIPGHRQPRQPNYDAAAAAAVIQGIGALIGSQVRQPRVRGQRHLE